MLLVFTITTAESKIIAATVIPMETRVFSFVMECFRILLIMLLQKQAKRGMKDRPLYINYIPFISEIIKALKPRRGFCLYYLVYSTGGILTGELRVPNNIRCRACVDYLSNAGSITLPAQFWNSRNPENPNL